MIFSADNLFLLQVVLTNPDVRGRQEILDLYLQDKPLSDDVDMKSLARGTPGFSGAGVNSSPAPSSLL